MDLAGFNIRQGRGISTIVAPNGATIGRVPLIRGLYRVTDPLGGADGLGPLYANATSMSFMEFHIAMGHWSFGDLQKMVEGGMIEGVKVKDIKGTPLVCRVCVEAKAVCKPFPKTKSPPPTKYGEEVSSDIWEPASVESLGRKNYFVLFIDRFSHETHVYFLHRKSDTFDSYQRYESWVRVQRDSIIKKLCSDRGGEYLGAEFTAHLEHQGTIRKLTTHDSPQSNSIAEHAMAYHVATARALLIQSGLPPRLWAEAIRFSVWLHNRSFTTAVQSLKTPYEIVTGRKPSLVNLRPWGSKILVKNLGAGKLESRVREGRYLGPDEESAGVRVYWPDRRTVTVEREVFFDVPNARTINVEGERNPEEVEANFIYVFDNDTSSLRNRASTFHFPQELDDNLFETAESIPSSPNPSHPSSPSLPAHNEGEHDHIPDLLEESDDEDDDEEEDDDEVEKELLREEEEDREDVEENRRISPSLAPPVVPKPLQDDVMPGHFDSVDSTQSSDEPIQARRNAALQPGFYKESRTYNRRTTTALQPPIQESNLAAFITEIDEVLGQEGESVGGNPGLVSAVAYAMAAGQGSDDPTYEEAMSGPDREKWMEAIRAEVSQIEKMHTYNVVEADKRDISNIIGSRFVL
jgi:hypothetical protein